MAKKEARSYNLQKKGQLKESYDNYTEKRDQTSRRECYLIFFLSNKVRLL